MEGRRYPIPGRSEDGPTAHGVRGRGLDHEGGAPLRASRVPYDEQVGLFNALLINRSDVWASHLHFF